MFNHFETQISKKKERFSAFYYVVMLFNYFQNQTAMATITKHLSIDGSAISSIYLWILIVAISSPARIYALSTNDDSASSSAATSAQLRLSHLQNTVNGLANAEQHASNPSYLLDSSQYYQYPAMNRFLSRYQDTKRSWQNLQSSWGKRDGGDNGLDASDLTPDEYADLLLLLNKPYGVDFTNARIPGDDINGNQANEDEFIGAGEKRAWNKINAAWGKRLSGRNNNGENEYYL